MGCGPQGPGITRRICARQPLQYVAITHYLPCETHILTPRPKASFSLLSSVGPLGPPAGSLDVSGTLLDPTLAPIRAPRLPHVTSFFASFWTTLTRGLCRFRAWRQGPGTLHSPSRRGGTPLKVGCAPQGPGLLRREAEAQAEAGSMSGLQVPCAHTKGK